MKPRDSSLTRAVPDRLAYDKALYRPASTVTSPSYCAVRVVCGKRIKTVECLSVRPSVCLSVCLYPAEQPRRAASLLLSSGAGVRYRSIVAACRRRVPAVDRQLPPFRRFAAAAAAAYRLVRLFGGPACLFTVLSSRAAGVRR